MLEAFRGSDKPPAVATRTWYVPAARFGGRRLHGMQVPLGTVARSRSEAPSLSSPVSLSLFPCLSLFSVPG